MPRRNKASHGEPRRNRSRRARMTLATEPVVQSGGTVSPGVGRARGVDGKVCPRGKAPFATRGAAEKRLAEIIADPGPTRATMPCRVYKCEHCAMWHLSARPETPTRILDAEFDDRRRYGLDP